MRVFHNIDAANHLVQDILPLVRRQIPDCTLRLVGADPGAEIQRLAENPAVTVTGFVSDLNEYLNRSAVFVAPLRFAAGVQNKVLEAMAAGRPVVTTPLINAGLGAQPGEEILLGDSAKAIAGHLVALLRNEQLRAQIGQAGGRFVRHKYSWSHVVERVGMIERSLSIR
jgi:glycosyltransferase involved in cell wall biosynthesis